MSSAKLVIDALRIVVVMPNWLGDGVMATPFLRALRALYPAAHIAAVARPLVAPVCRGVNFVDDVKVYAKGEERAISRWMRGEQFDLGILLPNSFRSAWMLWRGRVKRRLGYARGGRSLLLTDTVRAQRKTQEQWRHDEAVRIAIRLLRQEEPIADGELVRVEVTGRFAAPYAEHRMASSGKVVRAKVGWMRDDQAPAALTANFQPMPAIQYYLDLARYLGNIARETRNAKPEEADLTRDRRMELCVTAEERVEAEAALQETGIRAADQWIVIVPGANFGSSKCWMPERFAAVVSQLADPAGPFAARVLVASSPSEMPIVDAILAAMGVQHRDRVHALAKLNHGQGISVGALKEIVRRSRLMICNDTGPRHFAAAFGVPCVTLFGPTDPRWAETFFDKERIVRINVPCGPCQLKKCPIDHRCMTGITVEMAMNAIAELWPSDNL